MTFSFHDELFLKRVNMNSHFYLTSLSKSNFVSIYSLSVLICLCTIAFSVWPRDKPNWINQLPEKFMILWLCMQTEMWYTNPLFDVVSLLCELSDWIRLLPSFYMSRTPNETKLTSIWLFKCCTSCLTNCGVWFSYRQASTTETTP